MNERHDNALDPPFGRCEVGLKSFVHRGEQSMGTLRSFAIATAGAALLFTLATSTGLAQKRLNLPIPDDDSDLAQAIALAGKVKAQAGQCKQCKSGGGKVDCDGANAAHDAIDKLRLALYSMGDPMQDMLRDIVGHMQQVQAEYDKLADRTDTQKRGLAWSKFLSDSGKIALDVISLSSSLKDLKTYADGAATDLPGISGMTVAPPGVDLGADLKMMDAMLESINGAVGAADDIKSAHVNDKGFLDPTVSKLLTLKGGTSDLAAAIRGFKDASEQVARAQELVKAAKTAADTEIALANVAKARGLAAEGAKGLANLAGKALGMWADYAQGQLAKEIAENEKMLAAVDPVLAGLLADQRRIHDRQALLKQALDAVRDAAGAANSCAANCPGNFGPALVPTPSGQSYGTVLKGANSAIADGNTQLSGLGSKDMCTEKKDDSAAGKGAAGPGGGQSGKPGGPCADQTGMSGRLEKLACEEGR